MAAARRRNVALGLALSLALVAGALLAWLGTGPMREAPAPAPEPPAPSAALVSRSLAPWLPDLPSRARQEVYAWARRHAQAKLRTVQIVPHSPRAYGPWTAEWDPTLEEAPADGSLAEWDVLYYITHNWSSYGQDILDIQPGDTVTVNGRTILVEGIFDYPKQSILDEIVVLVGDATVLQTCVPYEDYNRIAYGFEQAGGPSA